MQMFADIQSSIDLEALSAAFASGLPQLAMRELDRISGGIEDELRAAAELRLGVSKTGKAYVDAMKTGGSSRAVCAPIHPEWLDQMQGVQKQARELMRRIPWHGSVYETSRVESQVSDYAEYGHLLNKKLRAGKSDPRTRVLDKYVASWGPKVNDGKILYRGMTLSNDAAARLVEGAVLKDAGYSSATTSAKMAKTFMGGQGTSGRGGRQVLLEIQKGSGATELLNSWLAELHGGDEFLFPRGAKFKVISTSSKDGYLHVKVQRVQ